MAPIDAPVDVRSPVVEHAAEIVTASKDILRIATVGAGMLTPAS